MAQSLQLFSSSMIKLAQVSKNQGYNYDGISQHVLN